MGMCWDGCEYFVSMCMYTYAAIHTEIIIYTAVGECSANYMPSFDD